MTLANKALPEVDSYRNKLRENARTHDWYESASEVIVFGSTAAGLQRVHSDLDVLFIGPERARAKTKKLDLLAFPNCATSSRSWLESELASHVAKYGIWVKGQPGWIDSAITGKLAIKHKKLRVSSYLRSLSLHWMELDPIFRTKYTIKLRREIQRWLLLERQVPIPPTRLLDEHWQSFRSSPSELLERVQSISASTSPIFSFDLIRSIEMHSAGERQQRSLST